MQRISNSNIWTRTQQIVQMIKQSLLSMTLICDVMCDVFCNSVHSHVASRRVSFVNTLMDKTKLKKKKNVVILFLYHKT